MKHTLKPKSLYWASFNRFELRLPGQAVTDCSHSGTCDADVAHWAPIVAAQTEKDDFANRPTPHKIRAELAEYGAWDAEDLTDDAVNWRRLVWCAACNIAEDDNPDCSKPVSS